MPLALRELTDEDQETIDRWPSYEGPFAPLDYSLRANSRWLSLYRHRPGGHSFATCRDRELLAFALLIEGDPHSAEFYVAVRADHLGEGVGRKTVELTVQRGFERLGCEAIFLRVRVNLGTGIRLYSEVGFRIAGTLSEVANGIPTAFYKMILPRSEHLGEVR